MRIGLKALIVLGCAVLTLTPALIAGTLFTDAFQRRAETANAARLRVLGELAADQLGRRMYQLWLDVESIARTANMDAPEDLRRDLSFITALDPRYTWIGAADVEGTVVVASQKLLEGQSVAERPWFRRGLNGPVAIDVHEAKLLERLLPAAAESRRFVDFAAPIRTSQGVVRGVLGAHFDWNWVRENLGALQTRGVELLLVSPDRKVLYGPADLQNKTLSVGSAIAAGQATSIALDERWPDGKDYITVVVPTVRFRDMPSFGWSIIVRAETASVLQPTRTIVRAFWTILGAGATASLILLYFFAAWIAQPLRRLIGSAEKLADGTVEAPPYEETRYREASRLSAALVRLQTRLLQSYQKRSPTSTNSAA